MIGVRHMKHLRIIFLMIFLLVLTGCKTTLLVRDVGREQLTAAVKDYAGLHGYIFTYQNDATGSYRLSLGTVYVPNVTETTQTSESQQRLTTGNIDQTATSYERTTWQTVSQPGHYVEATAMLRLVAQGEHTLIILESNTAAGNALADFDTYLKELGYKVEYK